MKKKFLFGMIALLSISLFFLGCPTEADDDNTTNTPAIPPYIEDNTNKTPQQGAKTAKEVLQGLGFTVTDNGLGTITITAAPASGVISQPIAIPQGVTLVVNATPIRATQPINVGYGGTLEVVNGNTLTVDNLVSNGDLVILGGLVVTGPSTVAGVALNYLPPLTPLGSGGVLTVATGKLTVNGTFNLLDGTLTATAPVDINTNGILNYTDTAGSLGGAGTLTNKGRIYVEADLTTTPPLLNDGTIYVSAEFTPSGTFENRVEGWIVARGALATLGSSFTNDGDILVPYAPVGSPNVLTITGTITNSDALLTGTTRTHIEIGEGGTLIVDTAGTLINDDVGTIYIAQGGKLDATGGTFTHTDGIITVNGTYIPDVETVVGGQVNVGPSGVATYAYTAGVGDFTGAGIITVASGGSVVLDDGATPINFIGGASSIFNIVPNGSISYNNEEIVVRGTVTLTDNYTLLEAATDQNMIINAGGVLAIADGITLDVNATTATSTSTVTGSIGSGGLVASQIVLLYPVGGTGGGTIDFDTPTTDSNFYWDGTAAAEEPVVAALGPTLTYTWKATDANGVGSTLAGWSRP
jgi:hypothetical protein